MSIQVENSLKDANKEIFEQRTHFIPCKIEDNGSANVDKYFEPYIIDNGEGDLSATFRGHALDGTNMTLPTGYRGILVSEAKRPLSEDAERKFQIMGGFKEFVYWNWDKKPSKNDNIVKALDWVDIAEAIYNKCSRILGVYIQQHKKLVEEDMFYLPRGINLTNVLQLRALIVNKR